MEGKFELQFEDNEYYLVDGNTNDTVATTDKVLLKEYDGYMKKLSLKNCEDVANGYDLVELFDEVDESIDYQEFDFSSFKLGFKKAIEILGDKKFSEKELTMLFAYGHQIGMNDVLAIQSQHSPQPMPKPDSDKLRDELIQSLQQIEWDVEIIMECTQCQSYGYVSECRDNCNKKFLQPKLDADGCLILKRV